VASLLFLALAAGLGLCLTLAPTTDMTLRPTPSTARSASSGFWRRSCSAWRREVSSRRLSSPPLQGAVLCLWLAGVPLFALGLLLESPACVAGGAWLML